ncbi:hypothetical protein L1987_37971 [Smallanthus sonchifolius]|uniref:Uncharacterized protein n=1 Tax=Smallanthus sonchifolius TaxID=185202 RepID=A0ACB9HJN7_9ASTR|nr:hypothetical protein L1987_37971 [Smallanthus sonchifolius]
MASGSSKGFDFASDDILCSYEDYANQDQSNGSHSDSAIATNSAKEFNKSRMARTSVFPNSSYSPPDDSGNQEVIIMAVERSMKKHTDNVMRFLEGLSSRLSQLELYCYNLDKSIGEMRSDLTRDHGESDAKLKFLEKHLQEVHRSVQILRDKQELADTQKELVKLQLAQKESASQQSEEGSLTPDTKKNESSLDSHGQQLDLVPAPQPQRVPEPVTQPQAYYLPPGPLPGPAQVNQTQYPQSQPQQPPPQVNQTQYPHSQQQQPPPQVHTLPQYQQQWTPTVQPQPGMQPGSRPASPQVYPQYLMTQPPVNPSPEPVPNSMQMQMPLPMQTPYSGIPPPGSSQPMPYSYSGPVRTSQPQPKPPSQQPPAQHLKPGFGGQPGDGYSGAPNAYMMYDNEPGRVQHPSQGGLFYPPNQQQSGSGGGGSGGGMMARPPQQFMHNHPYNELIDKLVSMGYRGDHVMSVIQRLDESGQTVDFNAVLDKLNGHPGQRGWSG